jgi:hypothetical protein
VKTIGAVRRPEQIEFFLRLSGLWEGAIDIPPPPKPAARHRDPDGRILVPCLD